MGREEDEPAGSFAGVLGDLADPNEYPKPVGLPTLRLQVDWASGFVIDTTLSVIFNPRTRRSIGSATFAQRDASSSSLVAPRASPWLRGHGPML